MSKLIKFELEVDASNPDQVTALSNLLLAIGGHESESNETQEKPKKKTTPKKEVVKEEPKKEVVKEEPKKEVEKEVVKEEPKKEVEKEEETEKIELSDVRELLGSVISKGDGDTRDKCAAKLKEFGAKNVSTLDTKHYSDFVDFLNDLL